MSSSPRRNLHGRGRMVVGFKLPMQSVPITTNIVSSNRVHGEVYSIQHYVIKFVSDLRQVGGTLVSSTNKTELLLKVALNTIKQTNKQTNKQCTRSKYGTVFPQKITVMFTIKNIFFAWLIDVKINLFNYFSYILAWSNCMLTLTLFSFMSLNWFLLQSI